VLAVVWSFCIEVIADHRLDADGEITDAEAREPTVISGFIADLDNLGEPVCEAAQG